MKMEKTPIQLTIEILLRVLMLATAQTKIPETATKTAVHAPCPESALKAIEMESIPDPEITT